MIDRLQHLTARGKSGTKAAYLGFTGTIKPLLQFGVVRPDTKVAKIHRGEHLNVVQRVELLFRFRELGILAGCHAVDHSLQSP